MKKIYSCFLSLAMMAGFASTAIAQEPLWKNEDAPIAERVEDLLGRMTVDEKLNEKGYIVPGLGDAGDRLFGAK